MIRVGVVDLQGDVSEHLRMVEACGAQAVEVRTPAALQTVDGLIMPGGEGPTIGKLLARIGLDVAITVRAGAGMPVYGTCAGMILLAKEAGGGEPAMLGLMDIAVARNAYGRQRESSEAELRAPAIGPAPFRVAFVRAPVVMWVSDTVQVLATHEGDPVLVRQGPLLASTFHPEITGFDGIHRYFLPNDCLNAMSFFV
jgi:5'-phosphate synthase pdxT subunit